MITLAKKSRVETHNDGVQSTRPAEHPAPSSRDDYDDDDSVSGSDAGRGLARGVVYLFAIGFYFAPTIVAVARGHNNIAPIFIVNFFLGVVLVGWVIALSWAFTDLKHLERKRRSYL